MVVMAELVSWASLHNSFVQHVMPLVQHNY
jgi:hypothetical protein